jgi:hypothetical protein
MSQFLSTIQVNLLDDLWGSLVFLRLPHCIFVTFSTCRHHSPPGRQSDAVFFDGPLSRCIEYRTDGSSSSSSSSNKFQRKRQRAALRRSLRSRTDACLNKPRPQHEKQDLQEQKPDSVLVCILKAQLNRAVGDHCLFQGDLSLQRKDTAH